MSKHCLAVLGILTIQTPTFYSSRNWVIVDCIDNSTRHHAKGQDTWVRSQCGKQRLCSRGCNASNHNQSLTEFVLCKTDLLSGEFRRKMATGGQALLQPARGKGHSS
jgi:hypothetical protein